MSGIAGIFNLDGAAIVPELLQQMTDFLAFRGPDAQEIWVSGAVGLGHAMLRTTRESLGERQPASLDGETWITADARVDGRTELIQKLHAEDRSVRQAATDAELILHAYAAWGAQCVAHLLGDFAFAIWDGRKRRLFCARDHLGVKPFFYARVGHCLVFSNTLNCLRVHPRVSDAPNDQAIGDFLLFGLNQDLTTTAFADVQRLPPAHYLLCSAQASKVNRYWTLPIAGPIQYKRADEYVEHFRELLRTAVEDRLRTDRIGVFLTGGLDSSGVAATAKETLSKQSASFELRGHTAVYDGLIPDRERHYAGLVGKALGIPIHYFVADDYGLCEGWDRPDPRWPEPIYDPLSAMDEAQLRQVASYGRVVLTGQGGDPAFSNLLSYHLWKLAKGFRFGQLARDLGRYLMSEGRMSRLYLRTRLRRWVSGNRWRRLYPAWLNDDFARRLDLRARWGRLNSEPAPEHPLRPVAYQALTAPFWPYLFEGYDPGLTLCPLEARHPFFDIRLLEYLLALPPVPWCVDKELLRVTMRGILPESVRLREKTPFAADPSAELVRHSKKHWVDHFQAAPGLTKYVRRERVPPIAGEKDADVLWMNLRPLSLNNWLQSLSSVKYKYQPAQEVRRELNVPIIP
jgi:asparagine synthase (glutamine-hydrolysing)